VCNAVRNLCHKFDDYRFDEICQQKSSVIIERYAQQLGYISDVENIKIHISRSIVPAMDL
jgi:hypothetical protein